MSKKQKKAAVKKKKQQQRLYTIIGTVGLALLLGAVAFAVSNSQKSSGSAAEGQSQTAAEIGAVAPDFELTSISGEPVKLSDYRGRPVAVTFMHTW
ncbi:MAG TPA: redoxin domain-containing protein [Chloroflexi bacterium]|nr:redoxin domain-containing protein [Chloroflexota bacterium]